MIYDVSKTNSLLIYSSYLTKQFFKKTVNDFSFMRHFELTIRIKGDYVATSFGNDLFTQKNEWNIIVSSRIYPANKLRDNRR